MRAKLALVCTLVVLLVLLWPGVLLAQDEDAHVVAPGETLATIAVAHGTTAAALMRANGLENGDLLRVGQTLVVPRKQPETAQHSGPKLGDRGDGYRVYTVKAGETLRKIADRFGLSPTAIARASGVANPDTIYAGMKLRIPTTDPPAYRGPGSDEATRFIASISRQRCWLYEDGKLTGNWQCSTGRDSAPTVAGVYPIKSKVDVAYGSAWDFWMPYWLGLYDAGSTENGIHGLPYNKETGKRTWEGMAGTPVTYGCIMLDDVNAKTLYEVATIGMTVIILR